MCVVMRVKLCVCGLILGVLFLYMCVDMVVFFFFKQKTAYEMRISDWSSDVCSSDLYVVSVIMCADARLRRLRIAPDMGPDRISPVIQRSEAMNETQTEVHGGSCCRGHEPKKAGPIIDPVCGKIGRAHV